MIPALAFSTILKLPDGLLNVLGFWKIPLININPFPVVPIPIVFAPPTVKLNDELIPVNLSETSSNTIFVS